MLRDVIISRSRVPCIWLLLQFTYAYGKFTDLSSVLQHQCLIAAASPSDQDLVPRQLAQLLANPLSPAE